MITPQKVRELMPLVDESVIQGALWDPDAGLVIPRSQVVAGEMIRDAEATGKLEVMANTPCTGLDIENGRIKGVHTPRGTIKTPYVVVCRSEEHTSELQSLMRISFAVFCLKKKQKHTTK